MLKRTTLKLVFGAVQSLIAFSAIILALTLNFNLFSIQSALSVPADALNFYVVILLAFGFISVAGGIFLVYEWWESRWKSLLEESEIQ